MGDRAPVYSNPLYYSEPDSPREGLVINTYPERIPIEIEEDIVVEIDTDRNTQEAKEEDKVVIIAAAMVNPKGSNELGKEWISLLNVSNKKVDLTGWRLEDFKSRKTMLEGALEEGESIRIYLTKVDGVRLTNTGGSIILKNRNNEVIDRETYVKNEVLIEDKAIRF